SVPVPAGSRIPASPWLVVVPVFAAFVLKRQTAPSALHESYGQKSLNWMKMVLRMARHAPRYQTSG
ncbi:MAG: hypothetical protein ACOZBW_12465, partial [Thermodesulfobacteriota bacterium]